MYRFKSSAAKQVLLRNNILFWGAAILIPPMLQLIPASHPPKILPLFIYMFLFTLAGLSTYMWNNALQEESADAE